MGQKGECQQGPLRVPKRVCYRPRSVIRTFVTFGSVKGLHLCQKVCKVGIFHHLTITLQTKSCCLIQEAANSLDHNFTRNVLLVTL